uniref:Selenoprotein H n=1 Tax=Sparus aurata TaxID=8175 RepID=A0A671UXY9_SPAAU
MYTSFEPSSFQQQKRWGTTAFTSQRHPAEHWATIRHDNFIKRSNSCYCSNIISWECEVCGIKVLVLLAVEVKSALLAARPELTVELNPEKPRKKTFEITLLDGETSLWSGIKRGPPARLKFPQPDVVVAALQEALKAE